MTRTRLGLLGLCAMVFGLMAFSATAAHAEVGAKWLILDVEKKIKTGAELHAEVSLTADNPPLILHSEILKIKTLFLCNKLEALNALLQEDGIIGNTVAINETTKLKEGRGSKIKFSECKTFLGGVETPKCIPTDPVGGEGTIITNPGHALAKLHELVADKVKDDIIEVLPDTGLGGVFTTIQTGPSVGNECPIGTKVPVLGSLSLKDCENMALIHLEKHLVEPFLPLTELFVISKTEEHKATLLGSSWVLLVGVHKDFPFSISNL